MSQPSDSTAFSHAFESKSGRRLGIDIGTVRIGTAISDPAGILATPLEMIERDRYHKYLQRISALVKHYDVVEVIIGLPRTLSNKPSKSTHDAIAVAKKLSARLTPIPVLFSDERLSTVTAQRLFRQAGISTRQQKTRIDQAAAVVILQQWLDQHHTVG